MPQRLRYYVMMFREVVVVLRIRTRLMQVSQLKVLTKTARFFHVHRKARYFSTSRINTSNTFGRGKGCYILHAKLLSAAITGNISKRKPV